MTAKRLCIFCNNSVDAWQPSLNVLSPFLKMVDFVGSDYARLKCPHCLSYDRERHLLLFYRKRDVLPRLSDSAVLEIGPLPALERLFISLKPARYIVGDLHPEEMNHERLQKVDIQQTNFPDETFDLVIANHVLEHVDDASRALREIHRILKRGGRAICQTPYAARLSKTFEDPILQSEEDRCFFYSQYNHVRLFGADIPEYFHAAGFTGRLVPHSEILPDIDGETFGVNEREPFFDFVRR